MNLTGLLPRHRLRIGTFGATTVATIVPSSASAHAFKYGQGGYMDFVNGTSVVLTDPFLLVAAVATGLAFAIWREDGMPLVWPGMILGNMLGALLSGSDLIAPIYAAAICGLGMGALGAIAVNVPVWPMRAMAVVAGTLLSIATLSGHEAGSIPFWSYFGVIFGINMIAGCTAGLAVVSRQRFTQGWMMIALRTLSSWMIALTVMIGALSLTSA